MKQTIAVTIMCVAMMLMGAHARADDLQSRCTRIGQKWVDFWNNHDVTKAFDVFTKDIVYEDIPFGVVYDGADAFQAFAKGAFDAFPIWTFTLVKSSCWPTPSGQQGFIEWRWSAVDDPGFFGTGNQINDVPGVSIIEIHRNRISRNSDYTDIATTMRQLGCDKFPSCH